MKWALKIHNSTKRLFAWISKTTAQFWQSAENYIKSVKMEVGDMNWVGHCHAQVIHMPRTYRARFTEIFMHLLTIFIHELRWTLSYTSHARVAYVSLACRARVSQVLHTCCTCDTHWSCMCHASHWGRSILILRNLTLEQNGRYWVYLRPIHWPGEAFPGC